MQERLLPGLDFKPCNTRQRRYFSTNHGVEKACAGKASKKGNGTTDAVGPINDMGYRRKAFRHCSTEKFCNCERSRLINIKNQTIVVICQNTATRPLLRPVNPPSS